MRTLAFATGDPAGVGPRVSVDAARALVAEGHRVLVFGDAARLRRQAPELEVVDTGAVADEAVDGHRADARCGVSQLASLEAAAAAVRRGEANALVTAPTCKEAVTLSGTPFVGQTEHLARLEGLADDDVTMLFLGPRLRVGLVTTHLPIREVPGAITAARVARAARHLGEAIARLGAPHGAQVVVAALNPHAGEAGLFGDEEARAIVPGVAQAAKQEPYVSGRLRLVGPVPAETALRVTASGGYEAAVAMMHDQATIPSKLLDWGAATNVTWGLPYLRTSVDHGTAFDAAAAGRADASGMISAARQALALLAGA